MDIHAKRTKRDGIETCNWWLYLLCVLVLVALFATASPAKPKPPILDPKDCPDVYDPNILAVAPPMSWLPADIDTSVISQVNVWNKSGVVTAITVEEVQIIDGDPVVVPASLNLEPVTGTPVPDPNGGYNSTWTWGFTPDDAKIYYFLFTASTPSKPHWKTDQRIVLVYVEDSPVLWTQDVPILTTRSAQRLWQYAMKVGAPMTKPTLVRLAKGS